MKVAWNRYRASSGWGTAALLDTADTDNAQSPHLAIDSTGNAVAVDLRHEATHDSIMSARFE